MTCRCFLPCGTSTHLQSCSCQHSFFFWKLFHINNTACRFHHKGCSWYRVRLCAGVHTYLWICGIVDFSKPPSFSCPAFLWCLHSMIQEFLAPLDVVCMPDSSQGLCASSEELAPLSLTLNQIWCINDLCLPRRHCAVVIRGITYGEKSGGHGHDQSSHPLLPILCAMASLSIPHFLFVRCATATFSSTAIDITG